MAVPTWLSGIGPESWGAIPSSILSSSGVMATGGGNVINAWGGGILVTGGLYIGATFTTGTFLVIFGGGHTDYSGNELYAFGPLENNSPAWNILRNPTSPAPDDVDQDGSGNPASRHVYDSIVYVNDGTRNAMYCMGLIFGYHSANSYNTLHVYNFNQASPNSNNPWSKKTDVTTAGGVVSVWDAVNNRIYYYPNSSGTVCFYDVVADTHTDGGVFKSPGNYGHNAASCLDPTRNIWAFWDYTGGISFFDISAGVSNDYYTPALTGTGPTILQGGIVYDSARDCFVVRCSTANAFYTLRAPATNYTQGGNAWVWNRITPDGGVAPTVGNTQGTFGRFQYVPGTDIKGYVLLNGPTEPIYFYNAQKKAIRPSYSKFPKKVLRK